MKTRQYNECSFSKIKLTHFLGKSGLMKHILSLMDWNVMEIQRVSLLNGFLTLFYLTIDLALLYRLSPLLYSVDAQITLPKLRKSLHTMFLWISFRIIIGFVNLQIVTIYFLWISFRIRIGFVNSFPLNIFYLPIDLALLYRLSPLLYSVDAQIMQIVTYNVPLNFL